MAVDATSVYEMIMIIKSTFIYRRTYVVPLSFASHIVLRDIDDRAEI